MTIEALLFTISAIGISETAYLIKKRFQSKQPICVVGEDCSKVLESRYRKTLFIPNEILGILFYAACSILAAFLVMGIQPVSLWNLSLKILLFSGSLLSIYFIHLQRNVIKAWCFWCIMSAFTIWLMAGIMVISRL